MSTASAQTLQAVRDDVVGYLSKLRLCDEDDDSDVSDEDGGDDTATTLSFESLGGVKSRLESLSKGICSTRRETRVLHHLHYDMIFAREDSIEDASRDTFAWVLADDTHCEQYLSKPPPLGQCAPPLASRYNESRRLLTWLLTGHGGFHTVKSITRGGNSLIQLDSVKP